MQSPSQVKHAKPTRCTNLQHGSCHSQGMHGLYFEPHPVCLELVLDSLLTKSTRTSQQVQVFVTAKKLQTLCASTFIYTIYIYWVQPKKEKNIYWSQHASELMLQDIKHKPLWKKGKKRYAILTGVQHALQQKSDAALHFTNYSKITTSATYFACILTHI